MIMLTSPFPDEVNLIENTRAALLDDVKTWDDSIRTRALGMAEAYLLNGAPMSPLFLDGASTVGPTLEEQTFLQGYWREKAGKPWDSKQLLALMNKTSLDDMKKLYSGFDLCDSVRRKSGFAGIPAILPHRHPGT